MSDVNITVTHSDVGLTVTRQDVEFPITLNIVGTVESEGGSGISDGNKGDITVSGSGAVWNINAGAVDSAELASNSVTSAKIASGNVSTDKLTDGAVTEVKIADGSVTVTKIGTGAVNESKLATGSVTETKLGARSVTAAKLFEVGHEKLIGRHGAGAGDAQEVGIDGGLEFHGGNIRRAALTGDVTASAGDNALAITPASNPSWIIDLAWSKLTGVPSTFAPSAHTHTLSNLTQSGATTGQVAQWNGTAWVPATAGSSVMKPRWNTSTATGSTTSTIPLDNTKPQNTEGVELITLSNVEPSSASNTIEVVVSVITGMAGAATFLIALFLDSDVDAIASAYHSQTSGYANHFVVRWLIPAWTGAKTLKVRIGPQSGTLYWNRSTTAILMDGTTSFSIIAKELEA